MEVKPGESIAWSSGTHLYLGLVRVYGCFESRGEPLFAGGFLGRGSVK